MPLTSITSNLLLETYPSFGSYTDNSHTVPASQDSVAVASIVDVGGASNHRFQATGGSRPSFKRGAGPNGHDAILNGLGGSTAASSAAVTANNFTVISLLKFDRRAVGTAQVIMTAGGSYLWQGVTGWPASFYGGYITPTGSDLQLNLGEGWAIHSLVSSPGGTEYRVNGRKLVGPAAGNSATLTGLTFGGGDQGFSAIVYEAATLVWSTALAPYQMAAEEQRLSTLFGGVPEPTLSSDRLLIVGGHSIAYGALASTNATSYVDLAVAALGTAGTPVRPRINAVWASSVAQEAARVPYNISLARTSRFPIVVLHAASNDLAGGTSAATTYAAIKAQATQYVAAGAYVLIATELDRADAVGNVNPYNALLRADFTVATDSSYVFGTNDVTHGHGILDYAAHPVLGRSGGPLVPTYSPDGVHLGDAGQAIQATIATAGVGYIIERYDETVAVPDLGEIEQAVLNAPLSVDVVGVTTGGTAHTITLDLNTLGDTDFGNAWVGGTGASADAPQVALSLSGAVWTLYFTTPAGSATFTTTVPSSAQRPSGIGYLAGLAFGDWTLASSSGTGAGFTFTGIGAIKRTYEAFAIVNKLQQAKRR